MRRCLALVVLFVLAVSSSFAQERSVKPGINARWEKPDMAEAADLLEQETDIYKRRHAIVATLGPESGSDFADVGAGSGFIACLLASEVGSEGKVYAVDISQESLDYIMEGAKREEISNIVPVLGEHRHDEPS